MDWLERTRALLGRAARPLPRPRSGSRDVDPLAAEVGADPAIADLLLLQSAAWFALDDPKERKRSVELLRQLTLTLHAHIEPDATFEIGAYEAGFSRLVRRALPAARIFAFEANPHVFERYRADASLEKLRIDYRHAAVLDRSGPAEFHIVRRRDGRDIAPTSEANSLLKRTKAADYETVEVPGWSLADLIAAERLSEAVATAWIDVEGALQQVLTGFGDRFRQFRLVHCEVEDRKKWRGQWQAHDVFRFLASKDFLPVARDFQASYQYNVMFLARAALANPGVRQTIAEHYSGLARTARVAMPLSAE